MSPPAYLRRLGAAIPVINELRDPAHNTPGHVSNALSVDTRAEPAPLTPAAAVGAFSFPSFAHAAVTTSQEQHNHG